MRYVISGQLRADLALRPAEYLTLAIREWELVLDWIVRGDALGYGRVGTRSGGAIVVEAASEAGAWALARALPFAPYSELRVAPGGVVGLTRELQALARARGGPAIEA